MLNSSFILHFVQIKSSIVALVSERQIQLNLFIVIELMNLIKVALPKIYLIKVALPEIYKKSVFDSLFCSTSLLLLMSQW